MNKNIFQQVRDNWALLAFVGSLIIGWTDVQNQLNENSATIQQQQVAILALDAKLDNQQSQVSGVAADIKAIKVSLNFIEADLKP